MCKALYVASDRPIPEQAEESLSVESLWGSGNSSPIVRHQFSKPYVMYVGAHRGCACGFAGEDVRSQQSLASLRVFLEEQLETVPDLELYGCWMGDEEEPPEERLDVTPDQLVESFDFCIFYRVRRAAEQDVSAVGARS